MIKLSIFVICIIGVAMQIPTDPNTLDSISKYLPVVVIIALAFFSFYLVRFILNMITVQNDAMKKQSDNMEKMNQTVERMGQRVNESMTKMTSAVDNLNTHVIEGFNDLKK